MKGLVDFVQFKKSKPNKSWGIISGEDCKMYWFSLTGLNVKVGDSVTFSGGKDEKGYIATRISVIV